MRHVVGKKRTHPAGDTLSVIPKAKANKMSAAQKKSAVTRKRAKAQGVGGKPTFVKTRNKSKKKK